jgi:hypothetical protein
VCEYEEVSLKTRSVKKDVCNVCQIKTLCFNNINFLIFHLNRHREYMVDITAVNVTHDETHDNSCVND